MRLSIRLNSDGEKNGDGTDKSNTVVEDRAENLRIEGGNLAYDVKGDMRTVALRDVVNWRIDGGPRQFVGDGTTDGPLFSAN